jgi:hypothetical protein
MTSLAVMTTNPPPIQPVSLKDIDVENDCFRMSFQPDLEALTTSMEAVGLVNPVIVRGGAPCHIVSGYRRVLVAQSLRWKAVDARVYDLGDMDDAAGLKLNFFENAGTREFNLIEASQVVTSFSTKGNMDSRQVRETILPLLRLPSGNKILQHLLSLNKMSADWKTLVVRKKIALANARKVAQYPLQEQSILYRVLAPLKLGHNKLSQCLDLIEDIAKRDKVSLKVLFGSEPFTNLLTEGELNTTERTNFFRRALRATRYPELSRTERQFQEERSKLSLPPAMSLNPPPFFEGSRLTLSCSFRSSEDLHSIIRALEKAAKSASLERILAML